MAGFERKFTETHRQNLLAVVISSVAAALAAGCLLLLRRRLAPPSPPAPPTRPVSPSLVAHITGLSEAEAEARQTPIDHEALQKEEKRRLWRERVRKHLITFFNLDMIGAAIAMYLLGSAWSAFLSLLILVLSFGLNVFQEIYTKRKLDHILQALQPQATVIREGKVRTVPLETVVPGDMLVVGIGDRIMANGEIVGNGKIWVEETAGSGGMARQLKQAGDTVFAGTICTKGQAVYCVNQVASPQSLSYFGPKASVLPRKPTPLQNLIERIFEILFVLVLLFNGLLFLDLSATWLGIAIFEGTLLRDIVSQIFAIAPTSLFLMIAVSYAVGLARMVEVGALVYRAETVESLANTSVICFSSSGTLTGQQATLETIPPPAGYDQLSESRITHILGDCLHSVATHQPILHALAKTFQGEPRPSREAAPFFSAFGWGGISFDNDDLRGTYILGYSDLLEPHLVPDQKDDQPEAETEGKDTVQSARPNRWSRLNPFRRFSSPPGESIQNEASLNTQDPPPENEAAVPAESEAEPTFRQRWMVRAKGWFAPKSVTSEATNPDKLDHKTTEIDLIFAYQPEVIPLFNNIGQPQILQQLVPLARVQLSESIRPEAAEVVQAFVRAGVKIKILSADASPQLSTTVKQLHLSEQTTPTMISGAELHQMDDATFYRTIQNEDFFARLTPGQKAEVVRGLRAQGAYVAMVGNQFNDISAMQQANLSITSQTDNHTALTMADIVLLKKSLTVLPNVLYRGQQIVNGLLDLFKLYLTHVASHLLLFMTMVLIYAVPAPYSSTQASIISFFGITVPAICLPFWASIGRVSKKSMTHQLVHFILPAALTTSILATVTYVWCILSTADIEYARIVVTHALVAAALMRVVFVKPPTQAWVAGNSLSGDWRPVWMTVVAAVIYIIFVAITAAVPVFQGWFDLDALHRPQDYLFIIVAVGIWAFVTRTLWRLLLRFAKWDGEF